MRKRCARKKNAYREIRRWFRCYSVTQHGTGISENNNLVTYANLTNTISLHSHSKSLITNQNGKMPTDRHVYWVLSLIMEVVQSDVPIESFPLLITF